MKELFKKHQNIRFIEAGASHQNGAAEHAIKTVFTMSSTMLMHAGIRCPVDTMSTDICPTAMDYDVLVYNHIPDMKSGLSSIEI